MRTALLMGFVLAVEVWAQRPQAPRFPQHSTGWPAVLPPQVQNHGTGLAASVAGRPMPLGAPGRARPFFPVIAPMWYPPVQQQPFIWVQPQPQMPLTVVQQQHAPVVTTSPDYVPDTAKPKMREFFAESRPYEAAEAKKPTSSVTLIALKDGTLVQAVAYWYEGATLHYVKPDHKVASTPLTLVDKESSERFNRERGLSFRMPE